MRQNIKTLNYDEGATKEAGDDSRFITSSNIHEKEINNEGLNFGDESKGKNKFSSEESLVKEGNIDRMLGLTLVETKVVEGASKDTIVP